MRRGRPGPWDGSRCVVLNINRPGTPSVSPGRVASQASEGPRELRRPVRRAGTLLEGIKHDAGGLVMSGDFDKLAITHPAERSAIVEVERARILFVDQLALQAVPREHQQLRVDRNLECVERRLQEPAAAFVRELEATSLNIASCWTSATGLFSGAVPYAIAGSSDDPINDPERWASRVAQRPPSAFTHRRITREVPRRIRTHRILRSLHPDVKGI